MVTATAYNTEGYKLWFKQGRFPIGIDGEATAHLLDNTPIPVKTLIDSGASKPILNKHFYDAHPFIHTYPRYKIATRGMVIGNDTVLPCNEAIAIMVKFSGHVFHMICYLLECSKDYGLYIGQKAMYELEGGADLRNLSFHFLMRSLNLYVMRRRGRLAPRQPLSVCALLPAPRREQASTASWKPRPPFEAAEMD